MRRLRPGEQGRTRVGCSSYASNYGTNMAVRATTVAPALANMGSALLQTQALEIARDASARSRDRKALHHQAPARTRKNALLLTQRLALARNTSARGRIRKVQRHQAQPRSASAKGKARRRESTQVRALRKGS